MIKLTKRLTLLFFSLMAGSVVFFSCTNVDKTLGLEFVPDDELREFATSTIYPDAFTRVADSMYTHSPGGLMVGSHFDPIFGETVAGAAFQMLPVYDSTSFGENPVYKSLILKLAMMGSPIGDEASSQILHVYELKERIYYDSVYYASTPIKTIIKDTPIATATYNGEDTLKIELGSAFAQKLFDASGEVMIYNEDTVANSKFFDYVKGFYIVADNSNGTNRMNFFNPYVNLTLTYSNDEVSDTTCIYSTYQSYDYYSDTYYYFAQFNTVKHDYSLATDPSVKITESEIKDTTETVLGKYLYMQGLFGATPYVKITNQKLQEWLDSEGLDASQVALIRAELIVEAEDNFSTFDIAKYPNALGGMTLLNPLLAYSYYYGTIYASGCLASFYYSPSTFDGTFNKGYKKYSFNITHEVADQLRNGKDLKFYLTPYTSNGGSASSSTLIHYTSPSQYQDYRAVMKGPKHDEPLKLVLTYALPTPQ